MIHNHAKFGYLSHFIKVRHILITRPPDYRSRMLLDWNISQLDFGYYWLTLIENFSNIVDLSCFFNKTTNLLAMVHADKKFRNTEIYSNRWNSGDLGFGSHQEMFVESRFRFSKWPILLNISPRASTMLVGRPLRRRRRGNFLEFFIFFSRKKSFLWTGL